MKHGKKKKHTFNFLVLINLKVSYLSSIIVKIMYFHYLQKYIDPSVRVYIYVEVNTCVSVSLKEILGVLSLQEAGDHGSPQLSISCSI